MPLSQVTDRIKEIPGQALRAVFGGVGQVLMAADKVRSRLTEQLSEGSGAAAGGSGPAASEGAEQARPAQYRSPGRRPGARPAR